jgi:hypothetical protein
VQHATLRYAPTQNINMRINIFIRNVYATAALLPCAARRYASIYDTHARPDTVPSIHRSYSSVERYVALQTYVAKIILTYMPIQIFLS